jgi:hypothetical protein
MLTSSEEEDDVLAAIEAGAWCYGRASCVLGLLVFRSAGKERTALTTGGRGPAVRRGGER